MCFDVKEKPTEAAKQNYYKYLMDFKVVSKESYFRLLSNFKYSASKWNILCKCHIQIKITTIYYYFDDTIVGNVIPIYKQLYPRRKFALKSSAIL